VPRYDTLLDLVRILGMDLVLVPRAMTPIISAMVKNTETGTANDDKPLYGDMEEEPEDE